MKDIRISIRLSEKEHYLFKTISLKRKESMQVILKNYVLKEIKEDIKNGKEEKN